ncbi:unnamed protein product [Symbiodinium natans]|uniref:Uncharacterized protein n=1 Tax=Symbiodinium natans TaxID=878477 RepID=A0A812RHR7_9DINO|nr:unnamed protein product [Symbiodinium natans]
MGASSSSVDHHDLEKGKRVVVLVHGLASCALEAITEKGHEHFWCDHCDAEEEHKRLVYVSIQEIVKRPQVVKTLALSLENDSVQGTKCVSSKCGYSGMNVQPVEGLSGIRTLNPGVESDITPILLWHNIIEHLSPDYNCLAYNYDWRRWGDVRYVQECETRFKQTIEHAVKVAKGQPVVIVGHSLGAQVVNYMLSYFGPMWTEANVSDAVLVGPANMGSPCALAAYANGPSTVTHTSVIPVADVLEAALRDVASTWPGIISVLPNRLGTLDVFDVKPLVLRKGGRKYFVGDVESFLSDLWACENEDITGLYSGDISMHEYVRHFLEEYGLVDTKREWVAGFDKAARMRKAFEKKVVTNLKAPRGCRVHVVYSMDIPTLSQMTFQNNLWEKADFSVWDSGDDTILASSVDKMCEAWRAEGVHVRKYHAPKIHHKEIISCPYMMKVMDDVMEHEMGESDDGSEYASSEEEDIGCGCAAGD